MSGFEEDFAGFLGQPTFGEVTSGFSGEAGARAALEAARIQAELGREGLGVTRDAQERLRQTLSPFVGVGTTALDTNLFGAGAADEVLGDPALQAALDDQELRLLSSQAASGRLRTPETLGALRSGSAQLASDFLSRQRGDILSAAQLGQASAAQQAASGLQSGQRASDILTQIGNATAAGGIGAAQARTQGAQNTASLATGLLRIFLSERKYKRNIELRAVTNKGNLYSYNYEWDDKVRYGYMVDEHPHAVIDCGAYKALDYARL